MAQVFLPNPCENPDIPIPRSTSTEPDPKRKPIKHLLIGAPEAVKNTIHTLYALGYARIDQWSPLQPTSNPGEVMSVLRRELLLD